MREVKISSNQLLLSSLALELKESHLNENDYSPLLLSPFRFWICSVFVSEIIEMLPNPKDKRVSCFHFRY